MAATVRWREDRQAWFLFVYQDGRQVAERAGPTQADRRRAERRAKQINLDIRNGRLGIPKREKPVRFDEFASKWVEEKVKLPAQRGLEGSVAPKTAAMRDQMIRLHLTPFLKDRDVRKIDSGIVDALEADFVRRGRLSRRSIDIALGTLRQILAHAQAQGLVSSNAVDTWKASLPSRGRRRTSTPRRSIGLDQVLEADEREDLLAAFAVQAPQHFPLVLFLAETGCRISEPLALTWSDVDLQRSEAHVYRRKTGDHDFIELSERLVAVLSPLEPDLRPEALHVFRTERGGPVRYENFKRRVWDPVVLDLFGAGRRVTPHTLRHTWASLHLSRGTPLEWVRRMGGWRSNQMLLDTYCHFLPREMRGYSNTISTPDRTTPNRIGGGERKSLAGNG